MSGSLEVMDRKLAVKQCRADVTAAVSVADFPTIERQLRRAWHLEPSASLAAWATRTLSPVLSQYCFATTRVAFLRSYTIEPAVQLLTSQALCERLGLDAWIGNFNTYSQEILQPDSELYRFEPNIVVLAVLTRSIAPELWTAATPLSVSDRKGIVDRVCSEFSTLFDHFRQHSSATMIVHTLELPTDPADGIGDQSRPHGQLDCIQQINQFLKTEVSQRSGFCLLNSERLVTRLGAANWYDQQRWNSMRLPMSGEAVAALAREWVRYLGALTLPPRKVAVVDLDNTLWRGIVGEDGYDGIRMDDSPEGWPHRSLQQTLLDLYHRGILLAVCSKNNYQDAWNVIEGHPEMVLRPQHFAAVRINWQDKGSNLREIAQELNVGLESLVFLDDNPQERELVRTTAPEVHVLDVSDDAAEYAQAMRDVIGFERIWLTEDDQKRGQMYAQQRQREQLKTDSKSLEAYLHSLATVVTLEQPDAATIQRVAQLTGKTNQFNLTTKRYQVQQIQEFHDSAESDLLAVSVQDRFGDNGIVGVVILCYHEAVCRIDTLLLSCRVIGRGIETAMLSMIVDRARERRCHSVCGHYLRTEKNAPCADYLDQHGFQRRNDCWMLEDLGSCLVEAPSWITIKSDFVTTHTNR